MMAAAKLLAMTTLPQMTTLAIETAMLPPAQTAKPMALVIVPNPTDLAMILHAYFAMHAGFAKKFVKNIVQFH